MLGERHVASVMPTTGAARSSSSLKPAARPAEFLYSARISSVLVAFDSPALGRGQGLVVAPTLDSEAPDIEV
jgi:hypothetical protein